MNRYEFSSKILPVAFGGADFPRWRAGCLRRVLITLSPFAAILSEAKSLALPRGANYAKNRALLALG